MPKNARQPLMSTLLTLALAAGVGYGMVNAERVMLGYEAAAPVVAQSGNGTSSNATSSVVSPTSGPAGTAVQIRLPSLSSSSSSYIFGECSVTWNGQAAFGLFGSSHNGSGRFNYYQVAAPIGTGAVTVLYSCPYTSSFGPAPGGSVSGSFTFTYATPVPPAVPPAITSLTPWSGSLTGDETVTITGTNLNGATEVTFGGTRGTIVRATATEVTVTTPAKTAGLVDVLVTTLGGQSPPANTAKYFYDDTTITYVLPSWDSVNTDQLPAMAAALRSRIGDGPKAKIGVSQFVSVNMNSYTLTPTNASAIRAELQSVLDSVRAMATRSASLTSANVTAPMPIGLSLITAIRDRVDGVQTAAEAEDRRNVQWYGDSNASATGWVTFSQYAKKLRRYQEAYIREFGTGLREIQTEFPTVPIIVTGDGEVEMTFARMTSLATANPAIGDYSPFAIAEFRDWVRGTGAYATGEPLELNRYILASRYTNDSTPGSDDSGDGHTFNANFGTDFTTWELEVVGGDPWSELETVGAIPTGSPLTCAINRSGQLCNLNNAVGFDAPRDLPISGGQLTAGSVFWQTWAQFRQEMVWRYNRDFAKWITEGTGATGGVPNTRFFSAQVPADKLFTNSSGAPNDGGVRLLTGASPHWVADIRPFGGAGVTGYNANIGGCSVSTNTCGLPTGLTGTGQPTTKTAGFNGPFFKTTDIVAPLVSEFGRWAIVEWNPADPFADEVTVYREDVQTVRRYRPALLMPFKIPSDHWKVFDLSATLPFETALKELMQGRTDGTASENHPGIATAGGWLPRITWATPQRVLSGTTLSATQLNATANVAGTFVYYSDSALTQVITPGNFTVTVSGATSVTRTLYTRFTPTDSDYGTATASVSLTVDPLPVMTVSPTAERLFSGTREINGTISSMTGTQLISVSFSNPNNGPWEATAKSNNITVPWITITNGSGTGAGLFGIGINTEALRTAIGNVTEATATVTVSATRVTAPTSVSIPIRVTLGRSDQDLVPQGQVDTPAQNTGSVQGSIGITGWVVDDRGVAAVKIYRDCLPFEAAQRPSPCTDVIDNGRGTTTSVVFMGDANFVSGARPDIEGLFPGLPATNTAGWGFLVLTQMLPNAVANPPLPNGGEGTFVIRAFAVDTSGKQTMLGRSYVPSNPGGNDPTTISLVNVSQATVKPFGAIDTPAQGATVSGVVNNFGWALTPDGDQISGNTGDISISQNGASTVFLNAAPTYAGNPLGQITFNYCRGTVGNPVPSPFFCDDDVSSIFGNPTPQASFTRRDSNPTLYRNLDAGRGPIGLYVLDTRAVSNGVYQLQWSVLDNLGRTEGIGSRFITVLNSGVDPAASSDAAVAGLRNAHAQVIGDAVALRGLARRTDDLRGRMGFNLNEPYSTFAADEDGVFRAKVALQERIEIDLGGPVDAGYLVANGTMRALPAGSTLYDGVFHWSGVPGYLGDYELAFVRGGERIDVTVTVEQEAPSIDDRLAVRMHLDDARVVGTSANGSTVEIGGWAYDPHAGLGAGVGAVHVWAKRTDVAGSQTPFFVGEATIDGRRPDVAAAFDDAPGTAGFGLFATLAPGTYEISSYVWVTRTRQFEDARTVTITVR